MSTQAKTSRSLRDVVARAIPLTMGAMAVTSLALIFGTIFFVAIFEDRSGSNDETVHSETLSLSENGELIVRKYRRRGELHFRLDGEELPATTKFSPVSFSFLNESLRAKSQTRQPEVRVERLGSHQAPGEWFFHRRGERGVYVVCDQQTRETLGYVGIRGFEKTLPPDEQQFDLSLHRLFPRSNIVLGWYGVPQHLNFSGASLNTAANGELILQDGDRRAYWVDFEKRSTTVLHDGDQVLAVSLLKLTTDSQARVALRFADRVEIKSAQSPHETSLRVPLPEEVHAWPTFGWAPANGVELKQHLFVREQRHQREILWADSNGKVTRRLTMPITKPSPGIEEVDGQIVAMPPIAAWVLAILQSPALSGSFIALITEIEMAMGRYVDAAVALPAIHGTTMSAIRWHTVRSASWPLLMTLLLSGCWAWAGQRRLKAFGATTSERWFWGVWIGLTGLPGYLALRVHRTWPSLRACPACSALTPCNEPACLKCYTTFSKTSQTQTRTTSKPDEAIEDESLVDRSSRSQGLRRWASRPTVWLERAEVAGFSLAERLGSGTAILIVKEVRATAAISMAALLVFGSIVASKMKLPVFSMFEAANYHVEFPFVSDGFVGAFAVCGVMLAIALGFVQTLSEGWNGAWLFLLHRPVSRRTVMVSKLITGWGLMLVLTAWPIVVYGWWSSLPGKVAAPFDWSMTASTWRLWWWLPLFYLGAFSCGLRPANWWGSRLVPLAAILGAMVARDFLLTRLWPWWLEASLASLMMAAVVTVILTVGRERDYS